MTGPVTIFVGNGHWISPAVMPGGKVHWLVVAWPASPGFCQYVCHFGSIRIWIPASTVSPGLAVSAERISRTCVWAAEADHAARPNITASQKANFDRTRI